MDCRRPSTYFALTAALCVVVNAGSAGAQRSGSTRTAYNPVSGQTEVDTRYHARRGQSQQTSPIHQQRDASIGVEQVSYYHETYEPMCECGEDCGDVGCGVIDCGDVGCGDIGCGDICGSGVCGPPIASQLNFYAGFEATFLKPHVGSNTAFSLTDGTATTSTGSSVDFDYDFDFTPRAFIGWNRCGGDVGVRATWWQFDQAADAAAGNPPISGLGNLTAPTINGVALSSTTPTDVFTALTDIDAYAIDLEGVKQTKFCKWQFGVSGGLRYASIEQGYEAQLANNTAALLDTIEYRQSIEGIGPTMAIEAFRPIGHRAGMFCKARGSLLFGDSKSRMVANEDLTGTAVTTTYTTHSDDILSIGEIQVGYRWTPIPVRHRVWQPYYSVAMEGQVWDGAGNATSQGGTLGFFGVSSQIGVNW